jgi:transposase
MTTSAILGIDVSKATLSLALLREGNRIRKKEVSNDAVGFAQLSEWLRISAGSCLFRSDEHLWTGSCALSL